MLWVTVHALGPPDGTSGNIRSALGNPDALVFLRSHQETASLRAWRLRQICLQALAGFAWGWLGVWVNVSHTAQTTILVMLMAVMSIGVTGILHYHAAVISYTTAVSIVPQAVSLAAEGLTVEVSSGLIVLLISLNCYLWESAGQLTRGLHARFYADALSRANHDLATRDDLTGLFNRREGMRRLEQTHLASIDTPNLTAPAYSLIIVDVDHFKQINDAYGHLTGDDVLRGVAERLTACLRPTDTLARVGGEEFMVILPGAESAVDVAERLRLDLQELPIPTRSGPVPVTASFGTATSLGTQDALATFAHADQALYSAKLTGRNRTSQFSAEMV